MPTYAIDIETTEIVVADDERDAIAIVREDFELLGQEIEIKEIRELDNGK